MSKLSFFESHRQEIHSAAMGYGFAISNFLMTMYAIRAVAERDALLGIIIAVSWVPMRCFHNALEEFLELMGKDDAVARARFQRCFHLAAWFGFVQSALMWKFFIIG